MLRTSGIYAGKGFVIVSFLCVAMRSFVRNAYKFAEEAKGRVVYQLCPPDNAGQCAIKISIKITKKDINQWYSRKRNGKYFME